MLNIILLFSVLTLLFFYRPPFQDDVFATHCLMEVKSISNMSEYIPLAKQAIFCVSTVFISDVLFGKVTDPKSAVLPFFAAYYD